MGQEIRPMNELSDRRIEDLPTRGKVGWGGGEKNFFPQKCNRRDGESKRARGRTNAGMHAPLCEHSFLAIKMTLCPKIMFGFVKVNNKHDIFPLVTPDLPHEKV